MQIKASAPAGTRPNADRWLLPGLWVCLLALGAYLRWSYPELTLFGLDQQTAVSVGQNVRLGWQLPLVGLVNSFGAALGPGEYYLMAVPQFFSNAPELSAAYLGLLGLLAGAVFSLAVWRALGAFPALAALSLYAAGPWAVYYTRMIWSPNTLPLFTAGAYALLLAGLGGRRRWLMPLGFLVLGAGTQVHHSAFSLVPGAVLCSLLLARRLRWYEMPLAALAFVLPFAPWLWHNVQNGFVDAQRLLSAGGQTATVDWQALWQVQTLVAGAGYPGEAGMVLGQTAQAPALPGAAELLAVTFWLGALLAGGQVARDSWRRQVDLRTVALALALAFVVVPALLNVRHSFPLYFRYFVCLFPVAFLFPALTLAAVPAGLARLTGSSGRRAGELAVVATLGLVVLGSSWQVETVNRLALAHGATPATGKSDMFPGPFIRDSRVAMTRLEQIVSADFETVLTGGVQRGPLEYLAANRYRLRYIDQPTMLVLPSERARMIFLPDAAWAADLALTLGANENKDVTLFWPPTEMKARVLDVDPLQVGTSDRFTKVTGGQVLPNGLELLAYTVDNDTGQEQRLLTVWRVANAGWAHTYWLYNSFAHLYTVSGPQVDVWGEVELSTSSNWKEGDLVVIPTRLVPKEPLVRGVYNLKMGVYVRFPARAPLPTPAGAVETASFGPAVLGQKPAAPTSGTPVAAFEPGIVLAQAKAALEPGQQQVRVDLVWRADATPGHDYTVFTHVYNAAGALVAQADGWPVAGNYPTSHWPAGEYILDVRLLSLKEPLPAGAYTVKVGLYDAKTMQRLPNTPRTPDMAASVGQVKVGTP
ncbi:MAG: hypothetical protein ACYC4L_12390 [Chloroflexota bacterium]